MVIYVTWRDIKWTNKVDKTSCMIDIFERENGEPERRQMKSMRKEVR